MLDKNKATQNLDKVIQTIEQARLKISKHHIVHIVAVSKYSTPQDIKLLYQAGQRAFGENKIQDLKSKTSILQDLPISWHFIGRLQKNKINNLIDLDPILFQSLDTVELAQELNKKLKNKNKTMNCLLQINSAKEPQKAGIMPEVAIDTYKYIQDTYTNINLLGVMCIGAYSTNIDDIKKSFDITKNIFDKINGKYCSMGMSNDFELAIQSGSNMVRLGSILFNSL